MDVAGNSDSTYRVAARLVKLMAFLELGIPGGYILVTIPGSLYILLLGGTVLVAPLLAFGLTGFALARELKIGRRRIATFVFELLHAGVYLALAVHSTTWTSASRFDEIAIPILQALFAFAVMASLCVCVMMVFARSVPRDDREDRPLAFAGVLLGILLVAVAFGLCGFAVAGD